MTEMSNFQKQFLAGSGQVQVFTQKEFDEALTLAKAEIMTVAIETTKQAIFIERDECAKIAEEMERERYDAVGDPRVTEFKSSIAEAIRNRIPTQRQ
jgi:thiazole synthase ThiGH ThiG subunit